jgi:hypothetical protein
LVLVVDEFIVDQFRQGEDKEKIALYLVHFSLFIQELLEKIKDEVCFGVLKGSCKSKQFCVPYIGSHVSDYKRSFWKAMAVVE